MPADKFVKPLVDSAEVVGASVGMVSEGLNSFASYGSSGVNDLPMSEHTMLEIGSITKAFTGILLAEMVQRGVVNYEDPVSKFLPSGSEDRGITLINLATHTSGLPRLAANMHEHPRFDPIDPYAIFDEETFLRAVEETSVEGPIGELISYSNFGFALLGYVLGRAAERAYEELILERICRPLGMRDTTATPSPDQAKRVAQGHDEEGMPIPRWQSGVHKGDGALLSTTSDMVAFLRANLDRLDSPMTTALVDAQTLRAKSSERMSVGLGWHVLHTDDRAEVWHNGGTGGFGAFAAFDVERGTGVIVLTNSNHLKEVDVAAIRLLRALSGTD